MYTYIYHRDYQGFKTPRCFKSLVLIGYISLIKQSENNNYVNEQLREQNFSIVDDTNCLCKLGYQDKRFPFIHIT